MKNLSLKLFFIAVVMAFSLASCGGGLSVDVDGFCDKYVDCCDEVGNSYCEIEGDPEVYKKQCKIQYRAAVKQLENNKPGICDEYLSLISDWVECVKEVDCDKWIGKDYRADSPRCDRESERIGDWVSEDYPGQVCGPGGI